MSKERYPLFLRPVFQERIWGGASLEKEFGYTIPTEKIGECWAISAHPNGPSTVENGEHKGKTVNELWTNHPELFGFPKARKFPLLTKIIDANDDLSIQVHPDDAYANLHENGELGKTECWYIIDCIENADIIIGHNARTKEELNQMIIEGNWDKFLHRVKIKPGDFFYVPSGTIHAICKGTLVLETQQSSDTTYRVYDYDRTDEFGNRRELHLQQAIDVTMVPHRDSPEQPIVTISQQGAITKLVESEYFSVFKWDIKGKMDFSLPEKYLLCSVIQGEGVFKTGSTEYPIEKGDHFLLPVHVREFQIQGSCQLIVSHP